MTFYTDFDQLRDTIAERTTQRVTSIGAWTAERQLAALDFEDSQRAYRKQLDAAREERVSQLGAQLFREHLARIRAGDDSADDALRLCHAPFSGEHEKRIADALRRGLRSFAFVQLRIALRMLRDDYRDEADSQTPEVTFEPRHVRLGDEKRKEHRTFRITGGL
jgi:hypothetical protein